MKAFEVARRIQSKGKPIEDVAELTELSIAEIEQLQQDQTH